MILRIPNHPETEVYDIRIKRDGHTLRVSRLIRFLNGNIIDQWDGLGGSTFFDAEGNVFYDAEGVPFQGC